MLDISLLELVSCVEQDLCPNEIWPDCEERE
jgi:hypothetical protein